MYCIPECYLYLYADVNDCVATACITVDSLRTLTVVPGKSHRYCQARNRIYGQIDVGGGELIEKRCSTGVQQQKVSKERTQEKIK